MRTLLKILLAACLLSLAACADWFAKAPPPNILLILADDLGYSDLGVLGGEINTPNLDALARAGKLLTNFHVGPTCSPTRAMLFSGADTHRAGLGTMNGMQSEEQLGLPGYEGFLNKQMITLPRLLREAGYHTYMAGKWQLGYQDGHYPLDRGFDRAFWLKHGGASHFSDMRGIMEPQAVAYWAEGRERLESLPDDFYSSVHITDKLIEYIDGNRGDGKPFFAYAAYTAPHWPLQAPQEYIDKYEGVYAGGYDPIRRQRVKNMSAAGLIKAGSTPAPRHPEWPDWEALSDEQKKLEVRRMQLYAAMVEALDDNIGRLIQYLQDAGEYDNTFIMFFSDNGAEGNNPQDLGTNPQWVPANFDNSYENMGKPGSYVSTGPGWAHVSNTPFHLYKAFPTQGGLLAPAIAVFPGRIEADSRSDAFATVLDVAPTFLQLANMPRPPEEVDGRRMQSLTGASLLPLMTGKEAEVHSSDYVYGIELFNRRMIRQGDWKLLWLNRPWGESDWGLYNLAEDPGEQNDLSQARPEKLAQMLTLWEGYVAANGVKVFPEIKLRFSNGKAHYQ